MSAPQFTPGPWTVDDGGIRCDHKHNYGIVAQARDGHVYSEYTSDPATLEFANIADMHLIAAAPELYEALVAVDLARHTDAPADWERATKRTDAALAKARGGQ